MAEPRCPICASRAFADFNGRAQAQCLGCGSLERGRQLWLVLRRQIVLPPGAVIAHFAPERFLMDHFAAQRQVRYRAFDVSPQHYPHESVWVEPFDLCARLWPLEPASVHLIIHNHVLEHLPCAPEQVLLRLKGLLRPGGRMLFTVPITGDRSAEGLDPATTPVERRMRAAQGEHLRVFGRLDFPAMLRRVLGADCLVPQSHFASIAELEATNIPVSRREPNGRSVFLYRNGEPEPAEA